MKILLIAILYSFSLTTWSALDRFPNVCEGHVTNLEVGQNGIVKIKTSFGSTYFIGADRYNTQQQFTLAMHSLETKRAICILKDGVWLLGMGLEEKVYEFENKDKEQK